MKIYDLVQMNKLGLLNPAEAPGGFLINGQLFSPAGLENVARNIGWTGRCSDSALSAIAKTAKFARAATKYIDDEEVLASEVCFESMRQNDSIKLIDRVAIRGSAGDYTIVHGAPGISGYAVYNPHKSVAQPEAKFRSLGLALEYIN